MSWVKVSDQLPEMCVSVLTYGAKRCEWAVMIYTRGETWEIETASEYHSSYAPTHWMPLPQEPA